jgi:transposase
MQKEIKFNIITEGLKNGVSPTCRRYNISRTIYYRWLNRYKANGIEGLNDIQKEFVPSNKTNKEIEKKLLQLSQTYPKYGPKAIKYLLEESGIDISESAVYNVMKRHGLTNKESRMKFARKKVSPSDMIMPPLSQINSGECWICWITDYGHFDAVGRVYEYTIIDAISHIACTRLYKTISYENFENLFTAVAIPVAQTLNFETGNLCFFKDNKLLKQSRNIIKSKINKITYDNGFDITIHELGEYIDIDKINLVKQQYTQDFIAQFMSLIRCGSTFKELKLQLQQHVRKYNLCQKRMFNDEFLTPVEYHSKFINSKPILPLWAYIDREY